MGSPRAVFMGSPWFAVPVLEALERTLDRVGGEVVAVYTAPDRPAGRGRRPHATPVKAYAERRGLPVLAPERVTPRDEVERFELLAVDLVVLAAYGLLLPKPFLEGPAHGALNVHPSLLPRHRGAAPVAAAILEGDAKTGTTLMKMDEGLDTGPILASEEVPLNGTERTPELTERLFQLGARLLEERVPAYLRGELLPVPQPSAGVTVAKRLSKQDGLLDWTLAAEDLERRVRAFDAWPGTATFWRGRRLQVLEAEVAGDEARPAPPGTVVAAGAGAAVSTGRGLLVLRRVRLEGRTAVDAPQFVRGHPEFVGAALPS